VRKSPRKRTSDGGMRAVVSVIDYNSYGGVTARIYLA
jgi:hypothetical protein